AAPLLRGRLLAGLGWVRAYQARWADAEALLREGIAVLEGAGEPGREPAVQAWCRLATPLMNQQLGDRALEALDAGTALAERPPTLVRAAATCHGTRAGIHLLRGEHALAERHLRATIGLAGNDPQLRGTAAGAHSSLGALRGRQGRFAESAEAYATAVALM